MAHLWFSFGFDGSILSITIKFLLSRDRLREVVATRELTVDVRSSTRPTESLNKIKSIEMELERIEF